MDQSEGEGVQSGMPTQRDKLRVRKSKRTKIERPDTDHMSAGQRIGMVWPITVDAFVMKGEFDAESRLQRHVIRVVRRKG